MTTPFRADHVGSLLRPAALLEARAAYANGQLGPEALRQAEDDTVLEALRLQREVGLGIFTDGEYRRGSWLTDLAEVVYLQLADILSGSLPNRLRRLTQRVTSPPNRFSIPRWPCLACL